MKYEININTKQYDNKGNMDEMTVTSVGNLINKNDGMYVVYKEEVEGQSITNTIKVVNNQVTIIKYDKKSSNMVFKKDVRNTSRYATPYGMFMIETLTNKLDIEEKENHIKIYIEYNISIQDLFEGRNEVTITLNKL